MAAFPGTLAGLPDVDTAALDKRVWWRIVPFVLVLYIISILKRVKIGYAALPMNADPGIDPSICGVIPVSPL